RLTLSGSSPLCGRESGTRSGLDDDGGGAAGSDTAALEAPLRLPEYGAAVRGRDVPGTLRDGSRLARQGNLGNRHPARTQEPYVRGDQVSSTQFDDVTGDELRHGDLPSRRRNLLVGAPHHGGGGGNQLAQPGHGPVGLVLTGGPQHAADRDQQQYHA